MHRAKGVFSLIIISILSLVIIFGCVFLAAYGVNVRLNGEPFQIEGKAVYPNLDDQGAPLSYSAVLYDVRADISQGNAVTYASSESSADCKLTTAYFYGIEGDNCILYDTLHDDFFNVERGNIRGRALCYIPYLGVLLSLASSIAGIAVFAVLGAVVFILLIVYIVTFIKSRRDYRRQCMEEQETEAIPEDEEDFSGNAEQEPVKEEQAVNEEEQEQEEQLIDETAKHAHVEAEADEAKNEEQAATLALKVMSRGERYFADVTGSVEKVTKLERALNNLKEKKNVSLTIEPLDAQPAGSVIECSKDELPVIIALVKKLNEEQ